MTSIVLICLLGITFIKQPRFNEVDCGFLVLISLIVPNDWAINISSQNYGPRWLQVVVGPN